MVIIDYCKMIAYLWAQLAIRTCACLLADQLYLYRRLYKDKSSNLHYLQFLAYLCDQCHNCPHSETELLSWNSEVVPCSEASPKVVEAACLTSGYKRP